MDWLQGAVVTRKKKMFKEEAQRKFVTGFTEETERRICREEIR